MLYNFKKAVDKNELLPLSQFSSRYPTDVEKISLGYAESTKLMEYMYKTFGLPKMQTVIKAIGDPKESFDRDLQTTLGVDTLHLENNWHVSLGLPPTLSPLELTPTPVPTRVPPTPITVPVTPADDSANMVIVGILLVGVPLVGVSGLLIFVIMVRKHERERALAVQQAEQILVMSLQRPPAPPYPQPPYLQVPQQPSYPHYISQPNEYGAFGAPPPVTPISGVMPQPYEYGRFGAPTQAPIPGAVPQTPMQNGTGLPIPPAQNRVGQPVQGSTKPLEAQQTPKETGTGTAQE
jgi:hypothetical protein